MTVKNLETVRENHLMHSDRERKIIGRILEERIPPDVHFVKEYVRQE